MDYFRAPRPFWIVLLTDGQDNSSNRANPDSVQTKLASAAQAGQISGMIVIIAGGGGGTEMFVGHARWVGKRGGRRGADRFWRRRAYGL